MYNPYSVIGALDEAVQASPETVFDISSYHPWLETTVLDILASRLQNSVNLEWLAKLVPEAVGAKPGVELVVSSWSHQQPVVPNEECRTGLRWALWKMNDMSEEMADEMCAEVRQLLKKGEIGEAMLVFTAFDKC